MQVNSYQKASTDILKYLKNDATIFVINSNNLKALLSKATNKKETPFENNDYISILDILPNILSEIESCIPYPSQEDLSDSHFITELIASYGEIWIPTSSLDYKITETNFCDSIEMVTWQRLLRAHKSNDLRELTVLSIDPNPKVRIAAKKRLKTK